MDMTPEEVTPEEVTREEVTPKRRGRPRARHEVVEREIKENAAKLFAERGVAGTTLQDIADSMGMTRQAVYHYVANKDQLFADLVREVAEEPAQLLHEITVLDSLAPSEKLRTMAKTVALHQMANPDRFRLMIRSEADLPADLAEVYGSSRRRVLRELITAIDAGTRSGDFRAVNPRTAALGVIGMLNWIAWWYQEGDDQEAVAAELADMAVQAVAAPETDSAPDSARSLIRGMESQLAQLKLIVEGGGDTPAGSCGSDGCADV